MQDRLYKYVVVYSDEYVSSETVSGIVVAETHAKAMEKMAYAYGEENIEYISLEWLAEGTVFEKGEIDDIDW